jgi:hypothetical protein
MEITVVRLTMIENRLRKTESGLLVWQVLVICLVAALVFQHYTSSVQAQSPIHAPFSVVDAQGKTLFQISEWHRPGSPAVGAALSLFTNGVPTASFVTTGDMYKDARDPDQSYLNELKTYLYEYQTGKKDPIMQEVSSLALTKAGGSLVILSRPSGDAKTPWAARLTAAPDVGGKLTLFSKDGTEGKVIAPEK